MTLKLNYLPNGRFSLANDPKVFLHHLLFLLLGLRLLDLIYLILLPPLFKIFGIASRVRPGIFYFFTCIALFILSVGIFILGARGGVQLKPIKPIDAGILSNTQNSVLVLNSPFCILHTFLEKGLARKNYLSEDEIDKIYPTTHKFEGDFQKKNVLIIILESFSKEYVGYYNNGKYHPVCGRV